MQSLGATGKEKRLTIKKFLAHGAFKYSTEENAAGNDGMRFY